MLIGSPSKVRVVRRPVREVAVIIISDEDFKHRALLIGRVRSDRAEHDVIAEGDGGAAVA